jgi:flagellar biosynthesis activator protein FlaF
MSSLQPKQTPATHTRAPRTGRKIEGEVLIKGACKLRDCLDNREAEDFEEQLKSALRYNHRVWSIFKGELIKEDNPLPNQLKQNLLMLSDFVDKRILETMRRPIPEKVTMVIDINNNLAAGLGISQSAHGICANSDPRGNRPS